MTAKVRKRRRRRRDAIVSALLILFVICFCIVVVYFTNIFTVRLINIESDGERYQSADIINASGIKEGDKLFLIHMKDAEKSIVTALPYIQKAYVSRTVNGTVTINLNYGAAEYYIQGAGGAVLLDSDGKVLENNVAIAPDASAQISGVSLEAATPGHTVEVAETTVFENTRKLATLFAENGIDKITAYDFSAEEDIIIEIEGRIAVKISSISELDGKLVFLSEALAIALNSQPNGERVIFELTADGAWSARNENSIEEARRLARERMTATQPVTDEFGSTVEEPVTEEETEESSTALSTEEPAGDAVTEADTVAVETTEEQIFG